MAIMIMHIQLTSIGDGLLKVGVTEQEELNIDLVWDIIDWYRQAAILCRDKDLEQEAIAYSRMGRVYGKVVYLEAQTFRPKITLFTI